MYYKPSKYLPATIKMHLIFYNLLHITKAKHLATFELKMIHYICRLAKCLRFKEAGAHQP